MSCAELWTHGRNTWEFYTSLGCRFTGEKIIALAPHPGAPAPELMTYTGYLPKMVRGARVLKFETGKFLVDNGEFRSSSDGIQFRRSRKMEDRFTSCLAEYGTVAYGVFLDGWLQVEIEEDVEEDDAMKAVARDERGERENGHGQVAKGVVALKPHFSENTGRRKGKQSQRRTDSQKARSEIAELHSEWKMDAVSTQEPFSLVTVELDGTPRTRGSGKTELVLDHEEGSQMLIPDQGGAGLGGGVGLGGRAGFDGGSCPGGEAACLLALLLACLLACFFLLACLLVFLLACMLACFFACLLACLLACLIFCLLACLLVFLLAYLLACLLFCLLACLLVFFACFLACLLACLPARSLTRLLACLFAWPTRLHTCLA